MGTQPHRVRPGFPDLPARRGLLAKYRWACFAAGTPIRTASGSKVIEELVPGDRVLSRHEDDVEGAIFEQEVVEIFRRSSWLLRLTIDDRTIDTTPEHPFFVRDRGWTSAGELKAGDQLASLAGDWLSLQHSQILDQDATVYNVSIHEFHTYFVGEEQWGWNVWSHNKCAGMHHFWPVSLGNSVKYGSDLLTWLNKKDHTAIHKALSKFLGKETKIVGGREVKMLPGPGNPGSLIVRNFSFKERYDALLRFHKTFKDGAYLEKFLAEAAEAKKRGLLR